jgi:hypothetical protein
MLLGGNVFDKRCDDESKEGQRDNNFKDAEEGVH